MLLNGEQKGKSACKLSGGDRPAGNGQRKDRRGGGRECAYGKKREHHEWKAGVSRNRRNKTRGPNKRKGRGKGEYGRPGGQHLRRYAGMMVTGS